MPEPISFPSASIDPENLALEEREAILRRQDNYLTAHLPEGYPGRVTHLCDDIYSPEDLAAQAEAIQRALLDFHAENAREAAKLRFRVVPTAEQQG